MQDHPGRINKTVILFQTHFFDRWAAAAFRRLREGEPPHHDHVVLMRLPTGASTSHSTASPTSSPRTSGLR